MVVASGHGARGSAFWTFSELGAGVRQRRVDCTQDGRGRDLSQTWSCVAGENAWDACDACVEGVAYRLSRRRGGENSEEGTVSRVRVCPLS